jgi:hypothetical protein
MPHAANDPALDRNDNVPPCLRRVRAGTQPQPAPFPTSPATMAESGRAAAHHMRDAHEAAREALSRQPSATARPYPSIPRRREGLSSAGLGVAITLIIALGVLAPLTLHLLLSSRP